MTDYIKRRKAQEKVKEAIRVVAVHPNGKLPSQEATDIFLKCMSAINDIPSADVVEVVRCKDCIYWCKLKEDNGVVTRIHHNELRSQCLNINGLNKTDCITEANDYCSYGERAENECKSS